MTALQYLSQHPQTQHSVLVKIEAFLSKQLAGSRARKVYRHLFVIPKQTEQLSQELETAIRAFLVRGRLAWVSVLSAQSAGYCSH